MSIDPAQQPQPDSAIRQVALEVEAHVADDGWDQPARLFALVATVDLIAREPGLAEELSGDGYTPIEQPDAGSRDFEELLTEIEWPSAVDGCAAVIERIMLPPEAEAALPDDPDLVVEAALAHPDRQDVRLVAAVLRTGEVHSMVRGREGDAELIEGPDLVPGLIAQLKATLEP